MFPLLALMALSGFAGYQYSKAKHKNNASSTNTATNTSTNTEKSVSDKANIYNYYTNDSDNGNTLFNAQNNKKRTLFGNAQ